MNKFKTHKTLLDIVFTIFKCIQKNEKDWKDMPYNLILVASGE